MSVVASVIISVSISVSVVIILASWPSDRAAAIVRSTVIQFGTTLTRPGRAILTINVSAGNADDAQNSFTLTVRTHIVRVQSTILTAEIEIHMARKALDRSLVFGHCSLALTNGGLDSHSFRRHGIEERLDFSDNLGSRIVPEFLTPAAKIRERHFLETEFRASI